MCSSDLLGTQGQGFKLAMRALNVVRLAQVGARAVGKASHVLEQMIRDLKFTNELPVEHMWRILQPRMETTRRELTKEFGCSPEEMAIVRNASEANEIMIYGIDLKKGDEVIVTNQNYGRMIATWQQRERREGIVLKQISFKVPPPSDQSIVDQFAAAIKIGRAHV